jgi:hypothetical protein
LFRIAHIRHKPRTRVRGVAFGKSTRDANSPWHGVTFASLPYQILLRPYGLLCTGGSAPHRRLPPYRSRVRESCRGERPPEMVGGRVSGGRWSLAFFIARVSSEHSQRRPAIASIP